MPEIAQNLFTAKTRPDLVNDAIKKAATTHPNLHPVVIWDGYGEIGDVTFLNSGNKRPEEVDAFDPGTTIFIYACTQDDLGAPYLRRAMARGAKFRPIIVAHPALYVNIDTVARVSLENELKVQKQEKFAKWDYGPHDFINLIQALAICKDVPGAYVEVGCYQGSSGGAVLSYLGNKGLSRDCHFLDVFEGFTYEAARKSPDTVWDGGVITPGGWERIAARLGRYARPEQGLTVSVHKNNIITDDLPAEIGDIAVANVDVDLYEAVLAGLIKIAPRISRSGIMIVEDPGHSPLLIGARIALDEFLESDLGKTFIPLVMQSGQTFLIRK